MVQTNLGINIEILVLLVLCGGGLIFFAKSFQFGIIMEFILSGLCFMFAYHFHGNYIPAAIFFFIWLVMMALSLYITNKVTTNQGIL